MGNNKPFLREVKNFTPEDHLVDIKSKSDPSQTEKYLTVAARVAWALAWADEFKKPRFRIDDTNVEYDENCKQMIATCVVYDGEKELSRAQAGKFFDPQELLTGSPVQDACTAAKGRALANLGFGTMCCGARPDPHTAEKEVGFNIRPVNGFDPEDYLIYLEDEQMSKRAYLEVKYRVLWALLWAEENNIDLRFCERMTGYDPVTKQLSAECIIYDGDTELARGKAAKYYSPSAGLGETPVQNACTAAKGRALANLGFGTFYASLEDGDTSEPCDAGIPDFSNNPLMRMAHPQEQPAQAPKKRTGRKSSVKETAPESPQEEKPTAESQKKSNPTESPEETKPAVDAPAATQTEASPVETVPTSAQVTSVTQEPVFERVPMTLEEARAYVIPSGGYKGMTIGEVYVTERGKQFLAWYKDPTKGLKTPKLKSAALTVLETLG